MHLRRGAGSVEICGHLVAMYVSISDSWHVVVFPQLVHLGICQRSSGRLPGGTFTSIIS